LSAHSLRNTFSNHNRDNITKDSWTKIFKLLNFKVNSRNSTRTETWERWNRRGLPWPTTSTYVVAGPGRIPLILVLDFPTQNFFISRSIQSCGWMTDSHPLDIYYLNLLQTNIGKTIRSHIDSSLRVVFCDVITVVTWNVLSEFLPAMPCHPERIFLRRPDY
jgi:hypothetical protein